MVCAGMFKGTVLRRAAQYHMVHLYVPNVAATVVHNSVPSLNTPFSPPTALGRGHGRAYYSRLIPPFCRLLQTVAAMDVLVPKVGEIIGGSQREEVASVLRSRMAEMGVAEEPLKWYLDLRENGTVPHAGFGLGFERLVMYVTGIENIREAIPYPRWPGNAAV